MRLRMTGWPDLHVTGHAEASRIFEQRRDDSGEGASTFPDGAVLDEQGVAIGRISYNGRIWQPGTHRPGEEPIWDNRTIAESA